MALLQVLVLRISSRLAENVDTLECSERAENTGGFSPSGEKMNRSVNLYRQVRGAGLAGLWYNTGAFYFGGALYYNGDNI
jgi:hypothetical protein